VPGELGVVEVTGMNREYVGVNRNGRILQIDQNFDRAVVLARGKGEKRMFVQPQVIKDFPQGVGIRHGSIVLT
jgi:hypothetical protein